MLTNNSALSEISKTLFDIGAIKTGSFILKNGLNAPIYIDLRMIISFPELMSELASGLAFKTQSFEQELVCGVPYTAIPMATAYSLKTNTPMLMRRKELKNVGARKNVEGIYAPGQKVLVIEDIVTSGLSLVETAKILEEAGLIVENLICLIDREQGAKEYLKKLGYKLHALYNLGEILEQLVLNDRIDAEKALEIKSYLKKHQFQES